jgi:AcrR family transcriptional regulator
MSLKVDPRIKRTRQLLQNALYDLLREKEFHEISVQDITARAEVNRATFYAHFEDKYALFNHHIRETFLEALNKRLPDTSVFTEANLRALMVVVYEFLAGFSLRCVAHSIAGNDDQLFAMAGVQKEISGILLGWMHDPDPSCNQRPFEGNVQALPLRDVAATVTAWTMFGSSFQWSRTDRHLTSSEAADRLMVLIRPGLKPYLGGWEYEQLDMASAASK